MCVHILNILCASTRKLHLSTAVAKRNVLNCHIALGALTMVHLFFDNGVRLAKRIWTRFHAQSQKTHSFGCICLVFFGKKFFLLKTIFFYRSAVWIFVRWPHLVDISKVHYSLAYIILSTAQKNKFIEKSCKNQKNLHRKKSL